jgi:hypothetical protein
MILRACLLLLFTGLFGFTKAPAQTFDLVSAKELRARSGLPNFYEKVKKGKTVKIAYFGGSITEAKDGWREQSLTGCKRTTPKQNSRT